MSGMLNTVVQAAALSAFSNALAQVISAYQEKTPYTALNMREILIFVAYTVINTPVNVLWQEWLEATFPGSANPPVDPSAPGKEKDKPLARRKLDVKNTAIKFLLDLTVGAVFNIFLFVACVGMFKGLSLGEIVEALQEDSWPMYVAGAKLWPAVSVISFVFIPVERRVIFGSLVGVAWGVYLSLMAR